MRKLGTGRGLLQGLVLRGHAQPARSRQEGRPDDQRPSATGAQLLCPPSHQRLQRGDEQPHPGADQAGQWISQPRTPQTRPVLSSRKPRHAPNHAVKITRKTRKGHKCEDGYVIFFEGKFVPGDYFGNYVAGYQAGYGDSPGLITGVLLGGQLYAALPGDEPAG